MLRDTPSKVWDTQVSTFLLKQAVKGGGSGTKGSGGNVNNGGSTQGVAKDTQRMEATQHTENPATNSSNSKTSATTTADVSHWNMKKLRQYIAFVKHSIHPVMSAEARTLLVDNLRF